MGPRFFWPSAAAGLPESEGQMRLSQKMLDSLKYFAPFARRREIRSRVVKATLKALLSRDLVQEVTLYSDYGYELTATGRELYETEYALRQFADPSLPKMMK